VFINQTMPPKHTGIPRPSPLGISLLKKDCKSQRCCKAAHNKIMISMSCYVGWTTI